MATSNPIHPNEALLTTLFDALHRHDYKTMASCYDPEAKFRDIAFDRDGLKEISQMWRMICEGDSNIEVVTKIVGADDTAGLARVVEDYTVGRSKVQAERQPVHNVIDSRFVFKEGKILRQDDDCDAKLWARQAFGNGLLAPLGFLAGRIRFVRSMVANYKLKKFLKEHPEHPE